MANMLKGSKEWKMMPAPARGNIVRKIGEELKKNLKALGTKISLHNLGALTSLEMGKI
jgi:acyl-CoA reductase-like NAD-dependent aldehyde dehydrogenase